MSGNRHARLDRLRRIYGGRRAAPERAVDFSALTLEEQFELDGLYAALAPLPGEPTGRRLTARERRRLEELERRVVLRG